MQCLPVLIDKYLDNYEYTPAQTTAAYTVWTSTTNYIPPDYAQIFDAQRQQADSIFWWNSILVFAPVVYLLSLIMYVMVYDSKLAYIVEIFFYTLAVFILYGAGIIYRTMVNNVYDRGYNLLIQQANQNKAAYQASIVQYPAGLVAITQALCDN